MTVHEKIEDIGKSFPYNVYVVYTLNGNTGRIVDYTPNASEARSYVKIGRENGLPVYIAEYDAQTGAICYDFH